MSGRGRCGRVRARLVAAFALVGTSALVACRDATEVFVPLDRPPLEQGSLVRLTHSSADDRSPAWNAGSDTVYYAGVSRDLAPTAPGSILAMHRVGGGIARTVLRNVQIGRNTPRWLLSPTTDASSQWIAYAVMDSLRASIPCMAPDERCTGSIVPGAPNISRMPALAGVRLHLRQLHALHDMMEDDTLTLELAGVDLDSIPVRPGFRTLRTRFHPFQTEFDQYEDLPFRVAWSPERSRVVTSDGLSLILWEPSTRTASRIPGTEDGMSPAWSPDGEWIAYTWVERGDSLNDTCMYGVDTGFTFEPWCYGRRTIYAVAPARVVLVRPDGSDRQVLAEGRDPAWDAQGRLYVSAAGESLDPVRRYDLATGSVVDVPLTAGAREPAVSPDSRWLAYSRFVRREVTRDIYVVPLP